MCFFTNSKGITGVHAMRKFLLKLKRRYYLFRCGIGDGISTPGEIAFLARHIPGFAKETAPLRLFYQGDLRKYHFDAQINCETDYLFERVRQILAKNCRTAWDELLYGKKPFFYLPLLHRRKLSHEGEL